jgi:hypothetical protein
MHRECHVSDPDYSKLLLALWGLMIQCVTCLNEMQMIEGLMILYGGAVKMQDHNLDWLDYQDLARKYKCTDYFRAWQPKRTI